MTDPRLICEGCGERGEVLDDPDGGFCVRVLRDSGRICITGQPVMEFCCMTHTRPTEELAIQAWVHLWEPRDDS